MTATCGNRHYSNHTSRNTRLTIGIVAPPDDRARDTCPNCQRGQTTDRNSAQQQEPREQRTTKVYDLKAGNHDEIGLCLTE